MVCHRRARHRAPDAERSQVVELGGRTVAYAYDDAQRLISEIITGGSPSGTISYSYDFANRLVSASGGISIAYDGDGNRVTETAGGITTTFLVDELNPTGYPQVVEELVGGVVQRTYTYGRDLISQNHWNGSAWTPSYHLTDGLGSVRTLTDSSGSATDSYTYDAFGSQIATSGSTANRYGFTGELQQGDNVYLRARWYNANNGTFTSIDPFAGFPQQPYSLHPYQYGYSAPTTWTDPSGEVVATNDGFGGESDLDDNKKLFCVFRGGQWDEQKRICRERFRLPLPNNTIPPAFQQTPEKSDTDRLIDAIRGSEANTGVSSGRRGATSASSSKLGYSSVCGQRLMHWIR